MYNIELSKKEFGILIATAILLPLFCFIAGLFTTDALYHEDKNSAPQQVSLDHIVTEPASPQQVVAEQETYYVVQAGLFSKYNNANQYQYALHVKGIETQIINTPDGDKANYRLILDIFNSRNDALELLNSIKEKQNIELYVTHLERDDSLQKIMVL